MKEARRKSRQSKAKMHRRQANNTIKMQKRENKAYKQATIQQITGHKNEADNK